MESKILNFPESMTLASTLSKYNVSIPSGTEIEDILDVLTSSLPPKVYSSMLTMFSGMGERELATLGGQELTILLASGVYKNKIVELLECYKKVGST